MLRYPLYPSLSSSFSRRAFPFTSLQHNLQIQINTLCAMAEKEQQASQAADVADPFLVDFIPNDPDNPVNWPRGKKWAVTDVMSATGFNRIMVSTIMAPALPTIGAELGMNSVETSMSLSIYLLATAVGPLILAPLTEMYGRKPILHSSNIWFFAFNIACAFAKTKGALLAARFLAGFGASAIYGLSGGVLSDIWRPEERGRSLSMYLLIPLLGAAVGASLPLAPLPHLPHALTSLQLMVSQAPSSAASSPRAQTGGGHSGQRLRSREP